MSAGQQGPRVLPGDVVAVPADVAAQLIELAGFHTLRISARGTAHYGPLKALYEAGLMRSVPQSRTAALMRASAVPPWITTEQAAELLGVSERAITKRLTKSQLQGTKVGGRWRVDRAHVERLMRRK